MRIVETNHFLAQWTERVGRYHRGVRKLVRVAVEAGELCRHRRVELGILVMIRYADQVVCVVGIPTGRLFVLRTVMLEDMANRMGWNR